MALDVTGVTLGTMIQAELVAAGNPGASDPAVLAVWTAVSKAIVAHFVATGQVIIPIGACVVVGSAVTQTNPAPVLGALT